MATARRERKIDRRIASTLLLVLTLTNVRIAAAQEDSTIRASRWLSPGSDAESYLRYMQTLGLSPQYPFSLRQFGTHELTDVQRLHGEHPWKSSPQLRSRLFSEKGVEGSLAPVELRTWYNSAFAYGMNDGPVWAGKGLTGSLAVGVSAHAGALEIVLAPRAFWTQNLNFPIRPIGNPSVSAFADPVHFGSVDRPQRFGDSPYGRLDPGESGMSLTAYGVAAGISTANGWWGPMIEFPYILGNNAPGFPHVFVGTSRPRSVGFGRLHGRILYASLEQSDFSPVDSGTERRFAGGMIVVLEPRGLPGLEVGLGRFYHVEWPESGITPVYFTHLFESLLKNSISRVFVPQPDAPFTSLDNQLATLFARWVLPRSGFDFYAEYGREDHSTDSRDLLMEPDHSSTYGLGARKAWMLDEGRRLRAVRLELMNLGASSLDRHRSQGGIYTNGGARQGHTHLGQLLGTAVAVGGGSAASIALETFESGSLARYGVSRYVVFDAGEYIRDTNVQWVAKVERRVTMGSVSLRIGAHGIVELNRHSREDAFNLNLEFGAAWHP